MIARIYIYLVFIFAAGLLWGESDEEAFFSALQTVNQYIPSSADTVALKKKMATALAERDVTSALAAMQEAAEWGSPLAQLNMGICYANGRGVPKNDREAYKWFLEAAQEGVAEAQYSVGSCLYNGVGVEQNGQEAVRWFTAAARKGCADAQHYLALCYRDGTGVEPNPEQAAKWISKAAEQGRADSLLLLGSFYDQGFGVPKNEEEAEKCYMKASDAGNHLGLKILMARNLTNHSKLNSLLYRLSRAGDALSQTCLGYNCQMGVGMKPDVIEAARWYFRAADQQYAEAQCNIAQMYATGIYMEPNPQKAVEWYKKAAELGYDRAQENLGYYYSTGQGVPQDWNEAVRWYKKAAAQGNAHAMYNLSICSSEGKGMKKDDRAVIRWLQAAADKGYALAQHNMGCSYLMGINGVKQDYAKAIEYFRAAEKQGLIDSMIALSDCYMTGKGVQKDMNEAARYCRKAAEWGIPWLLVRLGMRYFKGDTDLKQSYVEAMECFKAAAEKGDAYSCYALAECYLEGMGTPIELDKAAEWFHVSAEQGYAPAQLWYGIMLLTNQVPEISTLESRFLAVEFFRKAAAQDMDAARVKMKYTLDTDEMRAVRGNTQFHYERKYENSESIYIVTARYMLGVCYEDGIINNVAEPTKAVEQYQSALELSSILLERHRQNSNDPTIEALILSQRAAALLALSHCYEHGLGVEPSAESQRIAQDYKRQWEEIVGKEEEGAGSMPLKYVYGLAPAGGIVAEMPDKERTAAAELVKKYAGVLCPIGSWALLFTEKCCNLFQQFVEL